MTTAPLLLLLLLLLTLLPHQHISAMPTITTPSGMTVTGTTPTTDCHRFLSIPYAEPPVGLQGRWSPPTPLKSGTRDVDGSKFPPVCMQPSNGWSSLDTSNMSEDCLYLNIFTPTKYEPQSLPVLVFIHGGRQKQTFFFFFFFSPPPFRLHWLTFFLPSLSLSPSR